MAELLEPPAGSVVAAGRTVFLREEDDEHGAAWRKIGHLTTYGWVDVLEVGDVRVIRYGLAELPDDAIEAAACAISGYSTAQYKRWRHTSRGQQHHDRAVAALTAAYPIIGARVRAEAVAGERQRIVAAIHDRKLAYRERIGPSVDQSDWHGRFLYGLFCAEEIALGAAATALGRALAAGWQKQLPCPYEYERDRAAEGQDTPPAATPTGPADPTYGRIDPDIQRAVDALEPESIGSRVAMENTLQARRQEASE